MIKTILLSIPIIFSASVGVWVNTDGTEKTVPCPLTFDDDRIRIPKGCIAHKPGVWLGVDRYRNLEVELAVLRGRVQAKDVEIKALEARVDSLTSQLLVCTAVPECPACNDHFFKHTITGATIGSVISLGGCALWSLSR
jgi:hypothetical protein